MMDAHGQMFPNKLKDQAAPAVAIGTGVGCAASFEGIDPVTAKRMTRTIAGTLANQGIVERNAACIPSAAIASATQGRASAMPSVATMPGQRRQPMSRNRAPTAPAMPMLAMYCTIQV